MGALMLLASFRVVRWYTILQGSQALRPAPTRYATTTRKGPTINALPPRASLAERVSSSLGIAAAPQRTLLVLTGNLRCGEKAWESLYEHLVDPHNTTDHPMDLALVIGDKIREEYRNASLFQRAAYRFLFPEFGDWSEALDLVDPSWKQRVAPLLHERSNVLGGANYSSWKGSGAIAFWVRWFLAEKLVEHGLVEKYDRFIITRSDHFYQCRQDLWGLEPGFLWIPEGQHYRGVNDRYLMVDAADVLVALRVLPALFEDPSPYALGNEHYVAENLLLDYWARRNLTDRVHQFPRTMFTCGNAELEEQTRWSPPKTLIPELGVRLKYRAEYRQSSETCLFPR